MSSRFDAIDYARQLEAVGVPKAQAEVHARTLAQLMSDSVALPADLHAFEDKLTNGMNASEERITGKMLVFEAKISGEVTLLKWMTGLNTALLIGVFLKLFLP